MSSDHRDGREEALIATYFAPLIGTFAGAEKLQDDCAWFAPDPDRHIVLTVDAVAAGIHFLPDDPPADIAWKAVAVNVSDLIASGADPICYLLSIALPDLPSDSWMQELQKGLQDAQTHFAISLAGGDTDRRPGPLCLTVTAVGNKPRQTDLARRRASEGDLLYITGTLGDAAVGLRLRQASALASNLGLTTAQAKFLETSYLRPAPPLAAVAALRAHARATMDISDGLAKDAARMAHAAGVGMEIDASLVPRSAAFRTAEAADPQLLEQAAISGGDDYQILAAIPPAVAAAFERDARNAGVEVTQIGRVTNGGELRIQGPDGTPLALNSGGWDHFDTRLHLHTYTKDGN